MRVVHDDIHVAYCMYFDDDVTLLSSGWARAALLDLCLLLLL